MAEPSAGENRRPAVRRREREAGGRRSNRFLVSYNDDEQNLIRAAAEIDREAIASWVARAALAVAEESVVPVAVDAKAVVRELMETRRQLKRVGVNHNQIAKVKNSEGEVPDAQFDAVYAALLKAIHNIDQATLQLMRERRERG
ncbi:hypothetical protein OHS33_39385 (plasmid) [Streptomyces sp. NBC_00536]|uniref:hypothetical protein n=1 Tax=Streptomyces sp. NBC_00536 TaxID=2975769 RepID=UPI002E7FC8FD|nr:hypothetical protein [Streptomyces sp. NBC_00536]WUC84519.1 hypothetical protein OHS33_39385 [Streptomyces sp. NBC_00536]